jgi:nucleoside-diphosphate-sugar epimerase
VGPYAPTQKFAPGDITALGTNLVLHNILRPRSTAVTPGYGFVDVRDVASGLVAALKQTKSSRNLLSSRQFDFTEAIDYLAKVRPELKDRLPQLVGANTVAPIDPSNAVKRLGITVTEWEKTVVDTVDSLVQIEKDWAAAGVDVEAVFEQSRYRL